MEDEDNEVKTQTETAETDATLTNRNIDEINVNTLANTNDFLSKLQQLCRIHNVPDVSNKDGEWMLILIDCDDIGVLLNIEKISMIEAQNSINLLQASISKSIEKSSNNNGNDIFGYHFGSDLFALFVFDNSTKMTKSVEIAEYLLDVMQNEENHH